MRDARHAFDPARRRWLRAAGLGAAALGALPFALRAAANPRSRLILLGTAGGPTPKPDRAAPASAIVVDGVVYVIDCGNGVARQMVKAGLDLGAIRHVLLTHQHSDHNADYGNLLWLAWAARLHTRVDTWGPPPLAAMTRDFLRMNAADIQTRIKDEGRPPLAPLIVPHELSKGGVVLRDERVKVTAALVHHPPVFPAFAYRFDTGDRSIVISGDTTPSDHLLMLARDADVLVHEALYPPGVDRLVARVPNAPDLKRSIMSHHTTAEAAGQLAQDARVKTLVLSHLVPADDPEITDQMWIDAARLHFSGRILVGKDLLEI